jgi:hypothetical protein
MEKEVFQEIVHVDMLLSLLYYVTCPYSLPILLSILGYG